MTTDLAIVTTERAFSQIFARLALQLRWHDADEAAIRSYFHVLRDLPSPVLIRSAERIASERGRKYFPTTGEWRDIALQVQQDILREELGTDREWKIECADCEDTGWVRQTCDGAEHGHCDRSRKHLPHGFVMSCSCRATNRTYRRHHQLDQTRA